MSARIARVPYLNSLPFYRGLRLGEGVELLDCPPREAAARAAAGELLAGPLPLVEFFRLRETFERLGPFGIAVRGRAHSALLFTRKPVRLLDGAAVAVTEETSTTFCLLRLLLEQRYRVSPASYTRVPPRSAGNGRAPHGAELSEAEALLLIGDEAIRFRKANTLYPFELDVGFEWWLWQHLPFVFAVWAIRKDADPQAKRRLELTLARAVAMNLQELPSIAQEQAARFDLSDEEIRAYLSSFIYRLSQPEEEAIQRFQALVDAAHLL